ncbi:unnamed protein product [Darwinula stevensoni]|uniref:Mediator complex subunit Med25 PTOV domain-containing protein n=1 Tax=Darwinula stevensoni TaxID=69355 RepID=A0A7R8X504_9CRUS|nr:unnamed protein product [Darwinula stevensoni]CAG0886150.1 unnamed protein product [Darwinula stevensoni]
MVNVSMMNAMPIQQPQPQSQLQPPQQQQTQQWQGTVRMTMNPQGVMQQQGPVFPQQNQYTMVQQRQQQQQQEATNQTQSNSLLHQLIQPSSQPQTSMPQQNLNMGMTGPRLGMGMQGDLSMAQSQPQQQQQLGVGINLQDQQQQQLGGAKHRRFIWEGVLEWIEKVKGPTEMKIPRQLPCKVSCSVDLNGEPEIKAEHWPQKLIMQLIPKPLVVALGGQYFKNAHSVLFHPAPSEALDNLAKVMAQGLAGCVHFQTAGGPPCDIKVLMLLLSPEKQAYVGFIPNDQAGFVERIRDVIRQQKSQQAIRQQTRQAPGQGGTPPPSTPNPVPGGMTMNLPISSANTQITVNQMPGPGGAGRGVTTGGSAGPSGQGPSTGTGEFSHLEAERQQNLLQIQQLQASLDAAQFKEQQLRQAQVRRYQFL